MLGHYLIFEKSDGEVYPIGVIDNVDLKDKIHIKSFEERLIEACSEHFDAIVTIDIDLTKIYKGIENVGEFCMAVNLGSEHRTFIFIKEVWIY